MDYLLNLDVFWHLDDLLHVFLDWNQFGHLHYPLYDLFNDSINFHDPLFDSENLKNVINVNNIQNFLVDQCNDCLINFQNSSIFDFQLLELF